MFSSLCRSAVTAMFILLSSLRWLCQYVGERRRRSAVDSNDGIAHFLCSFTRQQTAGVVEVFRFNLRVRQRPIGAAAIDSLAMTHLAAIVQRYDHLTRVV